MQDAVTFQVASTADIDALVSLVRRYYSFDHIAFDEAEILPAVSALLGNPSLGRVWLIRHEGRIAGYAVMTFGYDHELGGRTGTITDLYIEAGFRHQGLGTKTMTFIEAEARQAGVHALELQARRDNVIAQQLYLKMGYTAYDRVSMVKQLRIFGPAASSEFPEKEHD